MAIEYPCGSENSGGDTEYLIQGTHGWFLLCLQLLRDLGVMGCSFPAPETSVAISALSYHQEDVSTLRKYCKRCTFSFCTFLYLLYILFCFWVLLQKQRHYLWHNSKNLLVGICSLSLVYLKSRVYTEHPIREHKIGCEVHKWPTHVMTILIIPENCI